MKVNQAFARMYASVLYFLIKFSEFLLFSRLLVHKLTAFPQNNNNKKDHINKSIYNEKNKNRLDYYVVY